MAKRHFNRRPSGLLVADDSIAVPRPWYAMERMPSGERGMGRRRCCAVPLCTNCSGATPSLAITYSLWQENTPSTCSGSHCADFNNTFVTTYLKLGTNCPGCWWQHTYSQPMCGALYLYARLGVMSGIGHYQLVVFSSIQSDPNYLSGPGCIDTSWSVCGIDLGASKPDCSAWNNLSVPYAGGGSYCNITSTACVVNAV